MAPFRRKFGSHRGGKKRRGPASSEPQELKRPGEGEHIGRVIKVEGTTKFLVRCDDEKERLCSIPGRLRRRFWIKENDIVIVKPWVVQGDERADIMWRYSVMDMNKLRELGALQGL